jgi:hypothetical protein
MQFWSSSQLTDETYCLPGLQHHRLSKSEADAHNPPVSELSHELKTPVPEHASFAISNWIDALAISLRRRRETTHISQRGTRLLWHRLLPSMGTPKSRKQPHIHVRHACGLAHLHELGQSFNFPCQALS